MVKNILAFTTNCFNRSLISDVKDKRNALILLGKEKLNALSEHNQAKYYGYHKTKKIYKQMQVNCKVPCLKPPECFILATDFIGMSP